MYNQLSRYSNHCLYLALQDFAKLAAWEDRGYYSMRASTERAQRKLHKLTRHATEVLKQPVAGVLAGTARAMGFADLVPSAATTVEIARSIDSCAPGEDGAVKGAKKRKSTAISTAKGKLAKLLKESKDKQLPAEGSEPEDVAAIKRAAHEAADAAATAKEALMRAALEVPTSCCVTWRVSFVNGREGDRLNRNRIYV